jgi:PIN domain nuclease of toxin-antitoxin system
VLRWLADERERVGKKALSALEAPGARIVISVVTVWEVAIKRGLGKLDAPAGLLQQLERARVELLPITARHADRVGTLPMHHRDPFDRLLIAQAEVEGFALVTGNGGMTDYEVEVVW